jgi:hypothetical protein
MGFKASKALGNAQDFFSLMQAQSTQREADVEAEAQRRQASLSLDESLAEAQRTEREAKLFRESQAHTYLSSGVLLQGTPLAVLEETRRLGEREVDAIKRRGQEQANLLRISSLRSERLGRNALFEQQGQQTIRRLSDMQKKEQQRLQTLTGGLGGLFGLGGGIATAAGNPIMGAVLSGAGALARGLF